MLTCLVMIVSVAGASVLPHGPFSRSPATSNSSPFANDIRLNFTPQAIVDRLGDRIISAGVSNVFNGQPFFAGLDNLGRTFLVTQVMAVAQFGIGELGNGQDGKWEGSLGHVLLHSTVGCVAAILQDADCAAGASAAAVASFYSGILSNGTTLSDEEQRERAQLAGALTGFLLSEGRAENVNVAASVAYSAIMNNRQLHRTEVQWIEENAAAFVSWLCQNKGICNLTREQSLGILAGEALSGVSDSWDKRRIYLGQEAREFLNAVYAGPSQIDGQTMFGVLDTDGAEYRNTLLNAQTAFDSLYIYNLATSVSTWPQGQHAAMAFLHEGLKDFQDDPRKIEAQAFITAIAQNPEGAGALFAAYATSSVRLNDPSVAGSFAMQNFLGSLPAATRLAVARGFAEGLLGRTDLTDQEIDNALFNGAWGPLLDLAVEEFLAADLVLRGFTIIRLGGRKIIRGPDGTEHENLADAYRAADRTLPPSYTRNADGSYTGPGGGKSWNTGAVDASGNPIMRRDIGGEYFAVDRNGTQIPALSPYESATPIHHVCTNKNCVSTGTGGPWTPRFEEFFDNAGLNINSEINKVFVPGHRGPHPAAYHQYVYDQLESATRGLPPNSPAYTSAVQNALNKIKAQANTPGHQVNAWLTGN
jgi:filamentous hemagglutinin